MKLVFLLLTTLGLYVLFNEVILYLQHKRSHGYKKLKSFQKEVAPNDHILDRLGNYLAPLLNKIPKKERIEKFILQAGSPYNLNFNKYIVVKILLTAGLYYFLAPKDNQMMQMVYLAVGFFGLDVLLWSKKKARVQKIEKELPFMLTKLARSTASGVPIRDVLTVLSTRLEGPLGAEVKLLSARYNVDGNLANCMPMFCDRIGMEEIDNMALAMIQSEQSGRMRTILEKQAEILKKKESFLSAKSLKNRANFLPLTTVAMVAAIFLLVAVPMILSIMDNGFFK
ncbi:type II secretion system F family protein [Aneurinibacillus tyrosinisolvens]|uniref:type II secretion system F family protein n=1 Tax=Aneurinibacillus tyrosinisolvens TaxID=1443435 RepID=UPI00063F335F|nr:type II secretion system F family protein [Aneurinibacillus tyrosinisolvens]